MNLQDVTEWNCWSKGVTEFKSYFKAQGKTTSSFNSKTRPYTSKSSDTCAKRI